MTTPCRNLAHSPRLHGTTWSCPDCTAGTAPSPLAAALAARDEAMARATAAHPDERARVEAAIRQLAATGRPFSANDARAIHGAKGGVVGAVFNALRTEGLIVPVGAETSTDRGTHGKSVAKWVGVAATERGAA